jgi:ectoine hydroxylase-related dioxygenase (phytanoyl-CoA dioxygenase family)
MSHNGYWVRRQVLDTALVTLAKEEALKAAEDPRYYQNPENYVSFETIDGKVRPARAERLVDVPRSSIQNIAEKARVLAEQATGCNLTLFKDKVNFKYPNSGAFLAHQDTPAFVPFGQWHVSVMVPLVDFTELNGTLCVAPTMPKTSMNNLAKVKTTPVCLSVGDLLIFDGWVPHSSDTNKSCDPRIGAIFTFTNSDEGSDLREKYYACKAKGGFSGLSLNQIDYTGKLCSPK